MDSFPQCQFCQQHFTLKGPVPYLLPCLHAVCETCVTSTAGGMISCSSCQTEVNLTETHLQKDVVRQREIFHLTVQHRPSELLCTHEDDGNQAVCWCQECEEFLCEHCQNMHESFKSTKRHAVQDIKDVEPGNVLHEEYCRTHDKYLIDLWDTHCNLLICSRCARVDHSGHEVEDIDEATDAARAMMEAREKEVESVAARHSLLLDKTTQQLSSIAEVSSSVTDNITHTFQSLRTLLDQREKELQIDLQQNLDQRKLHLDKTVAVSKPCILKCRSVSEYMHKALLFPSKYVLLSMNKAIQTTTQSCIDSPPAEISETPLLPTLKCKEFDNLKASLSTFGDINSDIPEDNELQEKVIQSKMEDVFTENQAKDDHIPAGPTQEVLDLQTRKPEFEGSESFDQMQPHYEQENVGSENKMACLQTQTMELEAERAQLKIENAELQAKLEQTEKMTDKLKGLIKAKDVTLSRLCASVSNIGLSPESTFHILKTPAEVRCRVLQCTHLMFDRYETNLDKVHITTEGYLVNLPTNVSLESGTSRLMKYWGTTTTFPLRRGGSPQYWEVWARLDIAHVLTGNAPLLEIGICQEQVIDQDNSKHGQPFSYSLTVAHCTIHGGVCRKVYRPVWLWYSSVYNTRKSIGTISKSITPEVSHVLCLPHSLPNIPRHSATLHYGVVYDDVRNKIVFLDVIENKVISTLDDIDTDSTMWPMFGVYNPQNARVSMSLLVDHEIQMWEGKRSMIQEALLK